MQSWASGLNFGKQNMKTYKTPENQLYAFELDGSQDHLISEEMTMVTDDESQLIRSSVVHEPSPLEKISMIEAVSMIPRVVREFTIAGLEREAALDAVSPAQLYLANPGYKRLKDLDDEIAALRDLL